MVKITTSPEEQSPKGRTWLEPDVALPSGPWRLKDESGLIWNLVLCCPYCDEIMIEASEWAAWDWEPVFCDGCGCQVTAQKAHPQWVAEIDD